MNKKSLLKCSITLFFTIAFIFTMILVSQAKTIPQDQISAPGSIQENPAYPDQYTFSVAVPPASIQAKQGTDNNSYLLYSFNQNNFTTEVGKPKLPFIIKNIYLPPDAENVSLQITGITEEEQHLACPIYPVEDIVWVQQPDGPRYDSYVFSIDREFYGNSQGYYPAVKAETQPISTIRDLRYLPVKIYPIRYDPSTGKINIIKNITIKLTWTQSFSANRQPPASYGPHFNTVVKGMNLLNFTQDIPLSLNNVQSGTVSRPTDFILGTPTDYLIISANDFYNDSNVNTLANYRASLPGGGYNVSIVRTQDIYNSCPGKTDSETKDQLIKLFIRYVYDHWKGTNPVEFVLLIGDAVTEADGTQRDSTQLVPTHTYMSSERIATDYWYSCLGGSIADGTFYKDGYDLAGDVLIGRFPVQSAIQLQNMVNKTINYETAFSGDWRSKVGLFSGFVGSWFKVKIDVGVFNNIFNNDLFPYPLQAKDFYRSDLTVEKDGTAEFEKILKDNLNAGLRLTIVSAEGSPIGWYDYSTAFFRSPYNTAELTNNNSPTIILTTACDTGWFDHIITESLGESFVEDYDTGAVAYLGASRAVTSLSANMMQYIVDEIFSNHNPVLGSAILQVKLIYKEQFRITDDVYMENLLGDPALDASKMLETSLKPDLTCAIINYDYDVNSGNVTFHTRVKNLGPASAGNVLLQLYNGSPKRGGSEVVRTNVPFIGTGSENEAFQDITFPVPSSWVTPVTLYLVVNGDNQIDELYKRNSMSDAFGFCLVSPPVVYIGNGSNPKINQNKIVWIDSRNGVNDIYMRDLGPDGQAETPDDLYGGAEVNITQGNFPSFGGTPAIDGNKIVFASPTYYRLVYVHDALNDGKFNDGHDLITSISQHISSGDNGNPAIYGNKVVWTHLDHNASNYNVYVSDAGADGTFGPEDIETPLQADTVTQYVGNIYENKVVWKQSYKIYLSDLDRNMTANVASKYYYSMDPYINGNKIVWRAVWFDNRDICMYDLGPDGIYGNADDGGNSTIATDTDAMYATIYGSKIVWNDTWDGGRSIYVYDLGPDGKFGTSDDIPTWRVPLPPSIVPNYYFSIFEDKLVFHNIIENKVYMVNIGLYSSIIKVPEDYSTIQTAINNASNGQEIHVAPGVYLNEAINFKGKEIKVIADQGPAVTSINYWYTGGYAVTFSSNEDRNSVLQGFTINTGTSGVGIYCKGSSPTITGNILNGSSGGIGIYSEDGQPLITSNTATNFSDGILIRNYNQGLGAEVAYNTVQGSSVMGIGIDGPGARSESIHHNLIAGNQWHGMSFGSLANPQVFNNTIVNNVGSGISNGSLGSGKVFNNIISSNKYGIYNFPGTNVNHTYNDLWNNTSGNYINTSPGVGEIQRDPLLNSSYHLNAGSPCINTGDPTMNDPDGTRSDMGAYYYQGGKKYKNIDQK